MGLFALSAADHVTACRCVFIDPSRVSSASPVAALAPPRVRGGLLRGPSFACGSPAQVSAARTEGLDLRGPGIFDGADPFARATLHRFDAAFAGAGCGPEAVAPATGSPGDLFVSAASRRNGAGSPGLRPRRLSGGALRFPDAGDGGDHCRVQQQVVHAVAVVDPARCRAARRPRSGEIWCVRPERRARLLAVRPDHRAASFGGWLGGTGRPWLPNGDLGVLPRASSYVTGRIKDLIIVRRPRPLPQDIEVTVQEARAAIGRDHMAAFSVPGEETDGWSSSRRVRPVVARDRSRPRSQPGYGAAVPQTSRSFSIAPTSC